MAGLIPRSFIDDLTQRVDILDVISRRITLKKAGRNYSACCPFHNEKTPSFSVSPDKQFYHCFGCGASGDAVKFVMEYDGVEFVEAIEELASIMGMEVPREHQNQQQKQQRAQTEQDIELMSQAARFFQHQLRQHPQRQRAVDYLKSRGLTGEVVNHWHIGYAPPEWSALLDHLGTSDGARKRLIELRLVNQNDNGRQFDFFRDRIMFPIHNKRGQVVAFGGRIIDGDGPKYLNSPETRLFHKSYELYGLFHTRRHNRQLNHILVVEGYMDVVALSQYQIQHAVAALGTALTEQHIQTLLRTCSKLVFCFDGDKAGRKAAWTALENALPQLNDGSFISYLFLPEGDDPDSLVRREGEQAFADLIGSAVPLSQFFFHRLQQQFPPDTVENKAALKATAMPMINRIKGDNQRRLMLNELNRLIGDANTSSAQRQNHRGQPPSALTQLPTHHMTPIRRMIQLLLWKPSLVNELPSFDINAFLYPENAGIRLLAKLFTLIKEQTDISTVDLLQKMQDHPAQKLLYQLAAAENLDDEADFAERFYEAFLKELDAQLSQRIDELYQISKSRELNQSESQELTLLLKQLKT